MSTPTIHYNTLIQYSRSPIWIALKNDALANDNMTSLAAKLYVWPSSRSVLPTTWQDIQKDYSIQKRIQAEVSDLIRVFAAHEPAINDATIIQKGGLYAVNWGFISGSYNYSNNGTAASGTFGTLSTQYFLCFDGYIPKNLYNANSYLASNITKRFVSPNKFEALPILWHSTIPITKVRFIYPDDAINVLVDIATNSGIANTSLFAYDKLLYIPSGHGNLSAAGGGIPNIASDATRYTIQLEGSTGIVYQRYDYEVVCNGKQTPIQCAFVNQFGAMEYITFHGANQRNGNFTSSSYRANVQAGPFDSATREYGNYQDYNINSRESFTVNTGWVDESFGEAIKQLLMSENQYILRVEENTDVWYQVSFDRGSMQYQTSVNDKNINYTMTFTWAFDERLNLR